MIRAVCCLAIAVCMAACGGTSVNNHGPLGGACAMGADCDSGQCVDGVCCASACADACSACTAAKTGAADGTCAPVVAGTDPDNECTAEDPGTCGVAGTGCNGDAAAPACHVYQATAPCGTSCAATTAGAYGQRFDQCDGSGTCSPVGTATTCGVYKCTTDGSECLTACTTTADCARGKCNAAHVCAPARVALVADDTSCLIAQSYANLTAALQASGHTVVRVPGAQLAAMLPNLDVVVMASNGDACTAANYPSYDDAIGPWVNAGGGVVGSGWVLYNAPPVNIAALMPNSGSVYDTGAITATAVAGHPITNGITSFAVDTTYTPYGGTPKAGSTSLLTNAGGESIAQAWTVGTGRAVFVGPLYVDSDSAYHVLALTDGTEPQALAFFVNAIDWAGKGLN